jgi:serine/threonine protein kinase
MQGLPDSHPGKQQLADYAGQRLSAEETGRIAEHLRLCSQCRQTIEQTEPDLLLAPGASSPLGATWQDVSVPETSAAAPAGASAAEFLPKSRDFPTDLASHPQFQSKLRILGKIGQGGMGTVYLAEQSLLGHQRQVALKVINQAFLSDPDILRRFLAEVAAVSQLSHPNIVTVYDADQTGEHHFLVMEYVDGISLSGLLKQNGPLPIGQACQYARQVALGLQHANEKGLVHRDIKPSNLMLTRNGQVKILDFGLARLQGRQPGTDTTRTGACMGTPDYQAPEQARDAGRVDIRADLYSLGATLYCLLAGQPPFVAESAWDVMLAHAQSEPEPVQRFRPEVPAALSAVVAKMLAKQPEQRYQTPEEVSQALLPFCTQEPGDTGPSFPSVPVVIAEPTPVPLLDRKTSVPTSTRVTQRQFPVKKPRIQRRLWLAACLGGFAVGAVVFLLASGGASKEGPALGREYVNSFGMKMVPIPAGEFALGASPHDKEAAQEEHPPHRVKISPFLMDACEVTQDEYVKVTGRPNPSWFSTEGSGKDKVAGLDTSRFPVERISYRDAIAFCQELTARDRKLTPGWEYGLPTEAEWEYACRAGSTTKFHSGNSETDLDSVGWFEGNSAGRTHPVGEKSPNAWGLFDMHGNVREWCADYYDPTTYRKKGEVQDPKGPSSGQSRVLRGGSWFNDPRSCRASARFAREPWDQGQFGFRVVLRRIASWW